MADTIRPAAPLAPIGSFEELVAHFASGEKPRHDYRIGTEHEKFVFHLADRSPVAYEGASSIRALLEGLKRFGWAGIYEGETLIGLKAAGASISLEPGGQFELSGAPLEHLHQTCAEVTDHLREVREVAGELGLGFLGLGFSPVWALDDTPIMPKGRYKIMRDYMARVGRLGRQMMFRSCTVQVNLDFSSEADMVRKMQVSLALQPIATALFANSPFAEGRLNGYQSYRAHVWSDTDPDRTGMLPFAFADDFGYAAYARYALDVPMYFVYRNGRYIDVAGRSFRDFLAGKLPELPGERPTIKDWEDHLSTLFPEVRLKTYLEMRGADAGGRDSLCALPALWTGLLYDDVAIDSALELIRDWDGADREALRRAVPVLGLSAPIAGRRAQDVAKDVLAIARKGLRARDRRSLAGEDETLFLTGLEEIATTGRTMAQILADKYRTEWTGDLGHAFAECAY